MNDKPGWELQYQLDTLRADLAKAQARVAELQKACRLLLPHATKWAEGGGSSGPEQRDVVAACMLIGGDNG